MPTYCYSNDDGRVLNWFAPMGGAPQSLFSSGELFERDIGAEHDGPSVGDPWTDHSSFGLACHPDDRKKFMDDARAKGVPTYFAEDGRPEFRSSSQQRKYLKAYGLVNHDSYY